MTGLEFYGFHGCLPREKVQGQKFIVDLELYLDLRVAGKSDKLDYSVDYSKVYSTAKEIVENCCFQLIETVAENIAWKILQGYAVARVKVRVSKPQAPVGGKFDTFAVEIERGR